MEQSNSSNKSSWRIGRVVSIILCVIFIPIILLNTVIIVKTYVQPEHINGIFGIKPVIVLSGSMSPTYEPNSLIFIKEVDTDKLTVGDVICFLDSSAIATTHRINEIITQDGQTAYITKGDANNSADALTVLPSQVEGVYIGNIAGVGGVAMFMQSKTGMILSIGLPILLYFVWDIIYRSRENKKEKSRTQELEQELARLKQQQP